MSDNPQEGCGPNLERLKDTRVGRRKRKKRDADRPHAACCALNSLDRYTDDLLYDILKV